MGLKRSRPPPATVSVMHALVSCFALVGSALATPPDATTATTATNAASTVVAAAAAALPSPRALEIYDSPTREDGGSDRTRQEQRLAVVVPAHRGDLQRAVSSLSRWPTDCVPLTQRNVDLILYYAEGEEGGDAGGAASVLPTIAATAGNCFASTKLVYASLNEEASMIV